MKPVINSPWSSEPIEQIHTAYRLLKETVGVIRVPFSGSPLKGLQVLGFMESNLLSFDEVFILDANEGFLPSRRNSNPFLPEGLRALLGLATSEQEAMVKRAVFRRLVKSAGKVHIFYTSMSSLQRTGRSSLSGFSGVRSRFVEELLWEMDKEKKSIQEPVIPIPVRIPRKILQRNHQLAKEHFPLKEKLGEILTRKLSASFFNAYLRCPVMWFYQYVLNLASYKSDLEEGLEGKGYRDLGIILHEALRRYFEKFSNINRSDNRTKIAEIFTELFDSSSLAKRLGRERRFFVRETAVHRLLRYLDWFYENWSPFQIIAQELELSVNNITLADRSISLTGRIDLLILHNEELWIIDFKSGSPDQPKFSWNDEMQKNPDNDLLPLLRDNISDLQLPFYGFLLANSNFISSKDLTGMPIKACYHLIGAGRQDDYQVSLKEDRKEKDLRELCSDVRCVLDLIVKNILESEAFAATDDEDTCGMCDYSAMCECSLI